VLGGGVGRPEDDGFGGGGQDGLGGVRESESVPGEDDVVSQDGAQPPVKLPGRGELGQFLACGGECLRPLGGDGQRRALAGEAGDVRAHDPPKPGLEVAESVGGRGFGRVAVVGDAGPYVALFVPVEAGGAEHGRVQEDRQFTAVSIARVVGEVIEEVVAVEVEEAVCGGHGLGSAEGVDLGLVDDRREGVDVPLLLETFDFA
jgi:hypothetical protein